MEIRNDGMLALVAGEVGPLLGEGWQWVARGSEVLPQGSLSAQH